MANYIASVQVGSIFVGGNTGTVNGKRKYSGKMGEAVTLEQAYEMAQFCALNHLAFIKAALGDPDRVERVVKVTGYVNVASGSKICQRSSTASPICTLSFGASADGTPERPLEWLLLVAMLQ